MAVQPILVNGEAHPARAAMYLLFVARKAEGGGYAVALRCVALRCAALRRANVGADDSEAA